MRFIAILEGLIWNDELAAHLTIDQFHALDVGSRLKLPIHPESDYDLPD